MKPSILSFWRILDCQLRVAKSALGVLRLVAVELKPYCQSKAHIHGILMIV
jgi:hypothetical protein